MNLNIIRSGGMTINVSTTVCTVFYVIFLSYHAHMEVVPPLEYCSFPVI